VTATFSFSLFLVVAILVLSDLRDATGDLAVDEVIVDVARVSILRRGEGGAGAGAGAGAGLSIFSVFTFVEVNDRTDDDVAACGLIFNVEESVDILFSSERISSCNKNQF